MVERDLALAALRGPAAPPACTSPRASRSTRSGRARAAGVAATRARSRRTISVLTDEAVRSLDPNVKMNPPLRAERRPRGAHRGAPRRHDRLHRDRSRAARAPREGGAVRGGAVRRDRPRDGVRGALHASRRARACSRSRRCSSGMSAGPGPRVRPRRPRIEVGARGEPRRCSTSTPSGRCARTRFRSLSANSWLLGRDAHAARVVQDGRRRPGGVRGVSARRLPRCSRTARSSAAAPSAPTGVAFGEAVFTTGDDRLPGDRHRPELRGAARLLHGADGRQLRRRRRARSSRRAPHATRGAHAPARRRGLGATGSHEHGIVALDEIDTRALVLRLRDGGRDARARGRRRARARRSPTRSTQVRAQPPMEGQALVAQVSTPRAVRLRRAEGASASPSSTTARSARSSAASPRPAPR